jgi:hypothetical protein
MKRFLATLAAAIALLYAVHAQASALIDVQVVSKATGRPLAVYSHGGRSYVVGTPGERYSIILTNRTNARVMGVLSVDGVNAITGETAAPDQVGYVLGPYQQGYIAGWRKSSSDVAQFYFTPLPDSYAARTDRPDNVGVIGLAAFREYADPVAVSRLEAYRQKAAADAASPAPASSEPLSKDSSNQAERASGAMVKPAQERLGTGHGERETSVVTHTSFRRASSSPDEVVSIWYDSRERLASRGIIARPAQYCADPKPFPARFTPDPRG